MQSLFDELTYEPDVQPLGEVIPRPYQIEAVDAVFDCWKTDRSTLLVLPTGCGKSVCFSEAMRRRELETDDNHRMMVLAHRKELIYQACQHAKNAGLEPGIEMAGYRCEDEPVVVSTVQTLNAGRKCPDCQGQYDQCETCEGVGKVKRVTKFDPHRFSTLIIDEGHHATADSYRAVLTYMQQNDNLKVLLVTATPKRRDKVGLHNVCESVAYEMQLREAIQEGWLAPIRQQFVNVEGLDLSKVPKKNTGDLADGALERAFLGESDIEEEKMLHSITYPTIQVAAGRPTLVFASGQEHALKLTAAFNAYDGTSAEMVIDKTESFERGRIVERFKTGKTQILVNVACFTEGFDAPNAAVLANARPTASESLYLQMIGRVTRPLPGIVDGLDTAEERRAAIAASAKDHCLVLDFTGVSGSHQIVSVGDVLAGEDVEEMDLAEAIRLAKSAGSEMDMEALIEKAKQAREEREKRLEEERRKRQSTRHYASDGRYRTTDVDIFANASFDPMVDYKPSPMQASQKQVKFLMSLGVDPKTATGFTKRQAGGVITKLKNQKGSKFIVTFGKHKGRQLRDIPPGYVQWMKRELRQRSDLVENIRLMERELSSF